MIDEARTIIGENSKVKLSIMLATLTGFGAVGSAVVAYAVTTATMGAQISTLNTRADYNTAQRDKMGDKIDQLGKDMARVLGILEQMQNEPRRR